MVNPGYPREARDCIGRRGFVAFAGLLYRIHHIFLIVSKKIIITSTSVHRQHGFEVSLEVMLGEIIGADIIDAGNKGGYPHKPRRQKRDKAISPSVGMPENKPCL